MILTILMIIAFSMSTVLLSEINIMKGMGRSVIAFFAAESGIEEALSVHREGIVEGEKEISGTLGNESAYEVSVSAPGIGSCPPEVNNYCIKSIGSYLEARRAIWVTR